MGLVYIMPNAADIFLLTGLEVISLSSLLVLRSMILFLLNYHNYLKIKWYKWYEYRWSIHSFHLDLGKEQYKKERKRNFIKTFISTITKVLLKYVLLSYTFPFKMDFSIQTCIKFAL